MRTKTRMRLYRTAQKTSGEAGHWAELAAEELEQVLRVKETRGVGEAARTLQAALGEHLAALAQELADVEEQEYRRRDRARALRKLREEQVGELSDRLVRSRGAVAVLCGAPAVRKYFGRGKTPRRPDLLIDLGERAVARLRSEQPVPGGSKVPGTVLDAPALAAHLEEALTPLAATLDELLRLETRAGSLLLEKNHLERELERAQQDAARVLGGLYRLAGRDHLDERVQKVHRRRRLRRKSRKGASRAASAVAGAAAGASATASPGHRSVAGAPGTGAEVLRSSDGAPGTASSVPASSEGAPGTGSTLATSASRAPGTGSSLPTSAAGAPGTSSSLPKSSSGPPVTPSAVPGSRSGAVSERRATGEAAGSAVSERNARDTGPWHPVRRRRATGATASHPVPERGSDGEEASHPVPDGEAHDRAA